MQFDSVSFWLFFAIAWAVWRLLPLRAAKAGTLAASLVFYGWWRAEYLVLIAISTIADYHIARRIDAAPDPRRRRRWLTLSVVLNLGFLGVFKYTPFVLDTLGLARAPDGVSRAAWLEEWVVPVGISFYTFQSLSYTIDVHARRIPPARSFLEFFLFVSFFPQLVAGPILRARELLPQLEARRRLSWLRVQMGLYRCVQGLFLKIVVADNLAPFVEGAFNPARLERISAAEAWVGVVSFGAQIFADFAGYSGIAIGLAHLLGLSFPENFRSPYIASSLSEFWQRWHITLSRWLRDYLYVPLGGNRRGRARTYVNLLITMLLGGLWHGAAWKYVAWGAIHGGGLALERWISPSRARGHLGQRVRGAGDLARRVAGILGVFVFVHVAWVFFRAADVPSAVRYTAALFGAGPPSGPDALLGSPTWLLLLPVAALHAAQAAHEWFGLEKRAWMRAAASVVYLFALCVVDRGDSSPFLYFQF